MPSVESGSIAATLGLPSQMNAPSVCRGAFTGWPQMIEALDALVLHPEFNRSFHKADGASVGGPAQLLKALSVDPAWLTRPAPPDDIYAHVVWLSMRVYAGARGIALSLAGLPDLIAGAGKLTLSERGQHVRTLICGAHGLTERAKDLAGLSRGLAAKLAPYSKGLEAAEAAYKTATSALETTAQDHSGPSIYVHAQATTLATGIRAQLAEIEIRGAEVGAYAVLANLATAMGNLAVAWEVAAAQFEKAGATDAERLADLAFLDDRLNRKAGAADWQAFATITQEFLQRALIVR